MRCMKTLVLFTSLICLLTGCQTALPTTHPTQEATMTPMPTPAPSPTATSAPVLLEYIGNSSFVLTAPDGTRIVSDPYRASPRPAGLNRFPTGIKAQAVTVSHAHPDHDNVNVVGGSPKILTEAGVYQIGSIKVTGFKGFEGSPHGPSELAHVVFMFEVDGAKIVQMGDSGPITDPQILAEIQNADILIANIDGYVIPEGQALPFIQQAKVRTFIPAHYSLSATARWQNAPTPEEFAKTLPAGLPVVNAGTQIQVKAGMPTQMMVMTPAALIKK